MGTAILNWALPIRVSPSLQLFTNTAFSPGLLCDRSVHSGCFASIGLEHNTKLNDW